MNVKNIVVFGSTGRTSRHLINQALANGYNVTAFARDTARLPTGDQNLKVAQDDIRDPRQVEEAIKGQDAVLSALGQTPGSSPDVLSVAVSHIVPAMKAHGVDRLVFQTGAGVADPRDQPSFGSRVIVPLLKLLSPKVLADAENAVATIRGSDVDWIVVRVPRLSDAPAKGQYQSGYLRPGFTPVSRADVANFMLKQLTDDTYLRQAPIVSY
ncbi:MAG TPA: SDR family oxidoreductase [Chloroflexota bacterium]|nr:SDR family oxidoreductase [Chloroflexota bacterium]